MKHKKTLNAISLTIKLFLSYCFIKFRKHYRLVLKLTFFKNSESYFIFFRNNKCIRDDPNLINEQHSNILVTFTFACNLVTKFRKNWIYEKQKQIIENPVRNEVVDIAVPTLQWTLLSTLKIVKIVSVHWKTPEISP